MKKITSIVSMFTGTILYALFIFHWIHSDHIHIKTNEDFKKKYMALVSAQENTPENLRMLYEESFNNLATSSVLASMEENPLCHGDAHEVGKVIFDRTNKNLAEAFSICQKQCYDGCYHGTLMQATRPENKVFGNSGHVTPEDFRVTMEKICALGEDLQSRDECAHAMGHGLYISSLDMEKSINLCEVYENRGLQYYCLTGVFMERDTYFGDADIKREDLKFPCSEFSDSYGVPCWRYKTARAFLLFSSNALENTVKMCLSFSGKSRLGCFHGLGHAKFADILKNPTYLNTVCSYATSEKELLACIDGAMEDVSGIDPAKARLACASLTESNAVRFCNSIDGKKDSLSRVTTPWYY